MELGIPDDESQEKYSSEITVSLDIYITFHISNKYFQVSPIPISNQVYGVKYAWTISVAFIMEKEIYNMSSYQIPCVHAKSLQSCPTLGDP